MKGGDSMCTTTENQIISLLQERDESALTRMEAEYGKLCRKISFDILSNQQDAEECFNDALMRVWNAIPPQVPDSLRAFVVTIIRRLSIDRYKYTNAKRRTASQLSETLEELADTLASPDDVETAVDQKQLVSAIESFIRSLPKEQGSVFLMRYLQMMPVSEVAERSGHSVGNTKVMLMRIRNKLRKHLKQEGLL